MGKLHETAQVLENVRGLFKKQVLSIPRQVVHNTLVSGPALPYGQSGHVPREGSSVMVFVFFYIKI